MPPPLTNNRALNQARYDAAKQNGLLSRDPEWQKWGHEARAQGLVTHDPTQSMGGAESVV